MQGCGFERPKQISMCVFLILLSVFVSFLPSLKLIHYYFVRRPGNFTSLIIMELGPFVSSLYKFYTGAHKIYKNMIQLTIVTKVYVGIFSKFGNYISVFHILMVVPVNPTSDMAFLLFAIWPFHILQDKASKSSVPAYEV